MRGVTERYPALGLFVADTPKSATGASPAGADRESLSIGGRTPRGPVTSTRATAVRGAGSYDHEVRHATAAGLDELEPLLERLRAIAGLNEKTRGVFYWRSRAFLHFHEDRSGLHADVRLGSDFERFRVQTSGERDALLQRIAAHHASVT